MLMKHRKNNQGVTLLEVLLVLTIGAMILVMTIRQYRSFRVEAEARQIKYNVDALFVAMSYYYKAECYGRGAVDEYDKNKFKPGKLNPANSDYQDINSVDIQNDLIKNLYLEQPLPLITLLDTSAGTNGFVTQFNMDDSRNRKICIEGDGATGVTSDQGCETSKNIGKIVTATIQVAIKMKDQATAKIYVNYLGADCLSSAGPNNTVIPCEDSGNTGSYVVWQRLPSFASPNAQGSNSSGNVVVNQFTREYTTYPAGYLISNNGESPSGETQYFLCGS